MWKTIISSLLILLKSWLFTSWFKLPQLNINRVAISGFSSGGFFAQQMYLAHSELFVGMASLSGGPFLCHFATPNISGNEEISGHPNHSRIKFIDEKCIISYSCSTILWIIQIISWERKPSAAVTFLFQCWMQFSCILSYLLLFWGVLGCNFQLDVGTFLWYLSRVKYESKVRHALFENYSNMSHLNFEIWAFLTTVFPIEINLVTLFDLKARSSKVDKLDQFWHFWWAFVKVPRFARNVNKTFSVIFKLVNQP